MPAIRNRIVETKRVVASSLIDHPSNWRTHPTRQRAALEGAVADLGQVQAVTVRRTPAGLQLVDGHLRKSVWGDQEITVNVVDLDDAETDKALLSLDPIAGLATRNNEELAKLLASVETEQAGLAKLLEQMGRRSALAGADDPIEPVNDPGFGVGTLFELGDHRLLCGDSTKPEDVRRLMAGQRASLMATDPHTDPGDIVYEPFSGSCSQIIAAEENNRICYAMELAPEFVAAAVQRWERVTGRKAERIDA